MYDVITLGSGTIDIFAHTEFAELISMTDGVKKEKFVAYPVGTKILVNELRFDVGGGGTNTAVCCARLGVKAAWLGILGDDMNAKRITDCLKKEKVDCLAQEGKGITGTSIILDSIAHDRTILAYKGVNDDWKFKHTPLNKINAKWLYCCAMTGGSYEEMVKLVTWAEKKGIKVVFNASAYLAKKGRDFLKGMLDRTDLFVLNDEEAAMIVGEGKPEDLCRRLLKEGPKMVVVTLGKDGSVATDGNHIYRVYCHEKDVVETTGAGDSFASTLMVGLIKENDFGYALKLGLANSESVVMGHGAKDKLLTWSEIQKNMRKFPAKIMKKRL